MTEAFNPYKGWRRNKGGDQPRLVSQCDGFEDTAILAQIGFITPEGAEVQLSYQRAVKEGLIQKEGVKTVRIDLYGKQRNK